jgi:arylsulfatase A-like enzyme
MIWSKPVGRIVAVLVMAAMAVPRAATQQPRQPPRLNVLVLFTDDQRYGTIGALGHPDVLTPNMDRLVARGTTFTRAHIMGGLQGAICTPSRAMLLTGRGLFSLRDTGAVVPPEHVMLPEVLKRAGYTTFFTGKWHNDRASFARAWTAGDRIFFGGMHAPKEGGHEAPWLTAFDPSGSYPQTARVQVRGFSSALYADAAVAFLERQSRASTPFLAYVSFTSPHDPRTPPEAYAALYDPARITLPPNVRPEHPFDNGELAIRDEELLPRPLTSDAVRRELAAYYAMISEVDAQIGRVLDALDRSGQAERTLIVFAGDNGLAVGSHGLLGKQNLYEESVRVPLVLVGPGVPAGQRRNALCLLTDVFPTVAELTGLTLPGTVQGRSLAPELRSPGSTGRDHVLYAYRNIQRGVRTQDDWKLIEYRVSGGRRSQLFNLQSDPWELRDLSEDPAYRDRLTALRVRLATAMREAGDPQASAFAN